LLNGKNQVLVNETSEVKFRDTSVGIVTGYEMEGWGSIPDWNKVYFFFTAFRPAVKPT
jgi:hypothetical protein